MSAEEKREKLNNYRKEHLEQYREYQRRYIERKKKEVHIIEY